ncbi:replication protein [Salmonella enterica]|nr:replication protein [Salmonella enterica]
MDQSDLTPAVAALSRIRITGNVTPQEWYQHIKLPNGKSDFIAITLLADIVYWYRATEVRDEITGEHIGYRKKFAGDKLQRGIQQLADGYGLTYRQTQDALYRLRDAGYITHETRTIITATGAKLGNVLFIEPIVDSIEKITNTTLIRNNVQANTAKRISSSDKTDKLLRQNVQAGTPKRITNTKITTESSTESKTPPKAPRGGRTRKSDLSPSDRPAFVLPDWIPADRWQDFVEMRAERKKPMTVRAMQLMTKKLERLRNAGEDVNEVLEQSVRNSWTDCYPVSDEKRSGRSSNKRGALEFGPVDYKVPKGFRG